MVSYLKATGVIATATVTGVGLAIALNSDHQLTASGHAVHPGHYEWPHNGRFSTFDHARLDSF
jgi:hypothetical protein